MHYFVLFVLLLVLAQWGMAAMTSHRQELRRLRPEAAAKHARPRDKKWRRLAENAGGYFAESRKDDLPQAKMREKEMTDKLTEAGLGGAALRQDSTPIYILCYLSWPVVAALAWAHLGVYSAAAVTVLALVFLVLAPSLWSRHKAAHDEREIEQVLPLFVDLIHSGVISGWDLSTTLEKVINALELECPGNKLVFELRQARWLCANGYTWPDVLKRVSSRIHDESVIVVARSLIQALEQGGDRTKQLTGLAGDVRHSSNSVFERRLALVPIKTLAVAIVLFISCFTTLLAPATVGGRGLTDLLGFLR
jgi:Flp pilus assembly protein TadB